VVVQEDEEMEREDERGMAKWPDLNELEMPERAELALDKIERRGLQRWLLQRMSPSRDGDNEPRQTERSE
jgi:hypothetical protein